MVVGLYETWRHSTRTLPLETTISPSPTNWWAFLFFSSILLYRTISAIGFVGVPAEMAAVTKLSYVSFYSLQDHVLRGRNGGPMREYQVTMQHYIACFVKGQLAQTFHLGLLPAHSTLLIFTRAAIVSLNTSL